MSPRPARALVIGASGFLGSRLLALAPRDVDLVGTGYRRPVRPGAWRDLVLDVTSPSAVRGLVAAERPQLVCYLAYDKARREITVDGARAAAQAAAAAGARFLFVSTDLIFGGTRAPYAETAPADPVLPYGRLKLEAEAAVRDAGAVVLRPALMWGESGTMQRPAYECSNLALGAPIDAYVDEWRTPVYVDDVARAIWDLGSAEVEGTWHLGGPERLSRYELARRLCPIFGFPLDLVREARRPDDRPADTSLDSTRLAALLGWQARPVAPPAMLSDG